MVATRVDHLVVSLADLTAGQMVETKAGLRAGQMVPTTVGLSAVLMADCSVVTKVDRLALKTADSLAVLKVARTAER